LCEIPTKRSYQLMLSSLSFLSRFAPNAVRSVRASRPRRARIGTTTTSPGSISGIRPNTSDKRRHPCERPPTMAICSSKNCASKASTIRRRTICTCSAKRSKRIRYVSDRRPWNRGAACFHKVKQHTASDQCFFEAVFLFALLFTVCYSHVVPIGPFYGRALTKNRYCSGLHSRQRLGRLIAKFSL
jgi:hypothetical protein